MSSLKELINNWTKEHTVDELEEMIVGVGIPFARILNLKQACELDVIKERNMLWHIHDNGIGEEIAVPGTPIKMHGCVDAPACSAPTLSQDTADILQNVLNKSTEDVAKLKECGAI